MSNSIHAILKKYSIKPNKKLGQHFLSELPTIKKIAASLETTPDDTVLEIGPGLGIMTGLIASKARNVIAVEKDSRLLEIAKIENSQHSNIEWHNEDILNVAIGDFVGAGSPRPQWARKPRPYNDTTIKIIGNLPYNISSPIIFWMIDNRKFISSAVVMIQKEVAVRLAAKPGNKDYGILSVILQAYADCKKLFDISASNFIPPPKVMSSVVKIDFRENPLVSGDENLFKNVVKAAFGKRRKTIRNALIGAHNIQLTPNEVDKTLSEIKIDPKRRAETLSVSDFDKLALKLSNKKR